MLGGQASRRRHRERPGAEARVRGGVGWAPVGPGATSFDSTVLDFGHHAGRSIEELAQTDPEYLRWRAILRLRYRAEISASARVRRSAQRLGAGQTLRGIFASSDRTTTSGDADTVSGVKTVVAAARRLFSDRAGDWPRDDSKWERRSARTQ